MSQVSTVVRTGPSVVSSLVTPRVQAGHDSGMQVGLRRVLTAIITWLQTDPYDPKLWLAEDER
jgi:hypothetical protein